MSTHPPPAQTPEDNLIRFPGPVGPRRTGSWHRHARCWTGELLSEEENAAVARRLSRRGIDRLARGVDR
jgi:hypothetical protein